MNKAALSKRLDLVEAILAEEIAQRGPNPLAEFTARQKAAVKQYQRTTDPLKQWIDCLNEASPVVQSLKASLPASTTEQQAQNQYQKMLDLRPVTRWRLK